MKDRREFKQWTESGEDEDDSGLTESRDAVLVKG